MATFEHPPKFFYNVLPVALRQAVVLTMIVLFPIMRTWPSTYFRFLEQPPGAYLLYVAWAALVVIFVSRIPVLVRALMRIPAVELNDGILLIRGWEDRRFTLSAQRPVRFQRDNRNRIVIAAEGAKPGQIYLRDLDGPMSLIRFLEEVAARQDAGIDGVPTTSS